MYSGSLIIHSFGSDTTTGASAPFTTSLAVGIPLTGQCNQQPYHSQETVTFPTKGGGTVNFTIPAYGGQIPTIDTNSDTLPDQVPGCGPTTVQTGDPLTGSGSLVTTGNPASSRTPGNPRGFTIPKSALAKAKTGASFEYYGVYHWEVHYADLKNSKGLTLFGNNGVFGKSLGPGAFDVKHGANRSAKATAGGNQFGGVMRLLGTYFSNEGYYFNNQHTSAAKYTWLFQYLGHGNPQTNAGKIVGGYLHTTMNEGYTLNAGATFASQVEVEAWGWTTGSVTVTGMQGTFPTVLARAGYDGRDGNGAGVVQMVSPMLTHWTGNGISSTAAIGILKIDFVPEPGQWLMLGAGVSMLGLLFRSTRK